MASPLPRLPPRLQMHLAELAVASGRPVPAFAAVTRVAVLRPCVAQTVAVDVAQVPLLAGLDALMAAGAVDLAGRDEGREGPTPSAMGRAVFAAIGLPLPAPPCSWPVRHLSGREIHCGGHTPD